jgi:hypothetical protein
LSYPYNSYKILSENEIQDLIAREKHSRAIGAEGSFKVKVNYDKYDLKDRYEERRY